MDEQTGKSFELLKKDYLSYLEVKTDEIKEQQEARRYYHGAHWTKAQIKAFNKRRQPVVTYNRIGRKINAVVGLLERQKSDPKGFPRTPKHEEGAEVATAVLRYVCDEQEWPEISTSAGLCGAVDGIGGVELVLEQGDTGDVEVGMEPLDPSGFFYDPRSLKADFSDARYMGVGKWADLDTAIEMFPDKEDELRSSMEAGSDLTSNPDHDDKWYAGTRDFRKIRIVDHWYLSRGEWHYCVYTGSLKLAEGVSPYKDQKGRTFCKYVVYSSNVDHDGDRYGFVRNMKSANDEINQRRSKGLHLLNSRRVIMAKGSNNDPEAIRREAARPDGVIMYEPGTPPPEFDDGARNAELTGQLGFLQDAKDEIENYGFNPALIGTGVNSLSGKAIQLQQQAGIAELGPYLISFRSWKLRVYRAIWNIIRDHWTAERWIRVTDDDRIPQFFAINQVQPDPMTGIPTMVNQLGALDVDIIIDEAPDAINMQMEAYETISVMAQRGQPIPPELVLELSGLTSSVKKRALEIIEKSKQEAMQSQQPAMQMEMEEKQAGIAKTIAEIDETEASADLKRAQAADKAMEASIKPHEIAHKLDKDEMDRLERYEFKQADMSRQNPAF